MQEYEIEGPSGPYTVQMHEEDAKAQGLKPKAKAAEAPANKARKTTTNKAAKKS